MKLQKQVLITFFILTLICTLALLWGHNQSLPSYEITPIGKTVILNDNSGDISMDLEEFLPLAVLAVWDISENDELLKMQFVITRTWLLNCFQDKHTMTLAELNAQSQMQIPCVSYRELKEKWEDCYIENYNRLRWLQSLTGHEIITYENALITPFFHGVSAGKTVNGATIYGKDFSYLSPVESTWDLTAPGYLQIRYLELAPLLENLRAAYPEVTTTVTDFFDAFSITKQDDTGYVLSVKLGDVTLTGGEFASACGFASACFSLEKYQNAPASTIRVTAKGSGNGLGVNLYGAKALANDGKNYKEILNYYYKNVEIREQ